MDRASSNTRFDYTTVGHVTRDTIEHGTGATLHQPGGSAFYSALQAARLGLRTLILTQGVPHEIEALLAPYREELELHVIPARRTTAFATRGTGASRSQRVLAWAGEIIEPVGIDTRILHLAPVARETPPVWHGDADFVGITPQGLVRAWAHDADVARLRSIRDPARAGTRPEAWLPGDVFPIALDPALLPERFDAAVISEHEHDSCRALFSLADRCHAEVAVTAGSRPTTVHREDSGGLQCAVPPTVEMRDDIGAGDVFAAAFFIALAEGRAALEAATFANAAAAARVAGIGPGAIGDRARIERLVDADRPS